jgi:hypothetical protein
MNKQINVSEVQPAALEIKGGTTMNNLIRNSLTITAFAALALVFGACSQSDLPAKEQSTLSKPITTDTQTDTQDDMPATDADLAVVQNTNDDETQLEALAVAPNLKFFFPTNGYFPAEPQFGLSMEFNGSMNFASVKNAFSMVVVKPNGKKYRPSLKFSYYTTDDRAFSKVNADPKNPFPKGSKIFWKLSRAAKDYKGRNLKSSASGYWIVQDF